MAKKFDDSTELAALIKKYTSGPPVFDIAIIDGIRPDDAWIFKLEESSLDKVRRISENAVNKIAQPAMGEPTHINASKFVNSYGR